MGISKILEIDGEYSLVFYCGELPVDGAIQAAGHEPNGYFWEGVAEVLAPHLVERLELDSEAGMFSAVGSLEDVAALQILLEPFLADPNKITRLVADAEARGFEFDD